MKYADLKVKPYSRPKRVGRGIASGKGKTAGRGTKGQKARTGYSAKPGFAGGSNPIMQKLPKLPGFTSHKVSNEVIYTGQLNQFSSKVVDAEALHKAGLISSQFVGVKLITKGELKAKIILKISSISASALEAIEKNGGSFESVERNKRPITKTKPEEPTKK